MTRAVIYGLLLLLVLVVAVYARQQPIIYHDVVVPAARIEQREVPPKIILRDRIVYRYPPAYLRATAPLGARESVARFCAPTVAAALSDTTPQPRTELIRSVTHKSALIPLRRGNLLVTSASSDGDLLARDYRVRDDFGVRAGDSVLVRYGRLSVTKEVARGFLWYVGFRLVEAGVRVAR